MIKKPSKQYFERLYALDSALYSCIEVSQRYEGILSPTGRHFYASVLFTSMCTRSVSLAIVSPYSRWAKRVVENWDYSSIAVMTRSIFEVRIAFFYLCIDECEKDEWDCRWNLFNLHDCQSRTRLFESIEADKQDMVGFEKQSEELRQRLLSNNFFMSLPEKQRNRFIKGGDAYLYALEDISEKAGVDKQTFKWLYRLLSSHVHGLPMSFYHMGYVERGRGVYSKTEERYTSLCLSFCVSLLVHSRDEMESLFKEVSKDKV